MSGQLPANFAHSLFNSTISNDPQSNPNLANMGLGPFLNLINSHHNSPQDTGTQNSSDEHGFYDGEADNLEDEKWQRGLIEDYSNDEQMDKVNNDLDEETLDEEVPADEDESYAHDLRTRAARDKQLIKAHLEQLTANAPSLVDHSTQNKENKPNALVKEEETVGKEQNDDDQMELEQSQPAENKRIYETADQPEHVQAKSEARPERTNGQSSDLDE